MPEDPVKNRLVRVRAELGESQKSMSRRFSLGDITWQRWESENLPPNREVLQVLGKLGFNLDWILTGRGRMWVEGAGPPATESDVRHSIVYIYDPRLAAGPGAIAFDADQEVGRLEVPTAWLERHLGVSPVSTAAFYISGDSMRPTLGDGDLAVVDRHAAETPDQVYAVRLVDEFMVKRVVQLGAGRVRLLSDNPVFPPIDLAPEQAADLVVLGRVRAVLKRV